MLLGGRVAEAVVFDDISGGASNDIQRASQIARNMVTRLGMSEKLGPVLYGSEHSSSEVFLGRDFSNDKNYSEETAALIDSEVKRIIDEAYKRAEKILRDKRDKLDFIAKFLVENEVMEEAQFKAAMESDATAEELVAMTEEKRRRSEEENEARRKELEKEAAARAEREAKERAEREARLAAEKSGFFADAPNSEQDNDTSKKDDNADKE